MLVISNELRMLAENLRGDAQVYTKDTVRRAANTIDQLDCNLVSRTSQVLALRLDRAILDQIILDACGGDENEMRKRISIEQGKRKTLEDYEGPDPAIKP